MTVERVKLGIYIWGFYPALLMLKEQELLENYENCSTIKQAMDSVYGLEFNTSTDKDNIKHVFKTISNEFDCPSLYGDNLNMYVEGFKKEVNAYSK